MRIESVNCVWDKGAHNAFTDLTLYKGVWYCAFREASSHALSEGIVRILTSTDFIHWDEQSLLGESGFDFRDPHFFLPQAASLSLVLGATALHDGRYTGRHSRLYQLDSSNTWIFRCRIGRDGDWLWRASSFASCSYSVSYRLPSPRRWTVHFMASTDTLDWNDVCRLPVSGLPNECALAFKPDGTAVLLLRRERGKAFALQGTAKPPYTRWKWRNLGVRIGGPQLIQLSDGRLLAGYRKIVGSDATTVLSWLEKDSLHEAIELPSSGDCSYPGLVEHDGAVYASWYSSHRGKPSIYTAQISCI
jgi:hypothetical protein